MLNTQEKNFLFDLALARATDGSPWSPSNGFGFSFWGMGGRFGRFFCSLLGVCHDVGSLLLLNQFLVWKVLRADELA